jgi:hypothetical protein
MYYSFILKNIQNLWNRNLTRIKNAAEEIKNPITATEIEKTGSYMDLSLSRAPKKNHEAMAQKPIVKTVATASDEASIRDVLVRAFAADPAARGAWSDPKQYFMHFPSYCFC